VPQPLPSLRHGLALGLARAAQLAGWGCAAAALVDTALTLHGAPHRVGLPVALRLVWLAVALWALFTPLGAVVLGALSGACRVLLRVRGGVSASQYPGLLPLAPAGGDRAIAQVARLWTGIITLLGFAAVSTGIIRALVVRFKEPLLIAAAATLAQLLLIALLVIPAALIEAALRRLGTRLERRLGPGRNILARPALTLAFAGVLAGALLMLPPALDRSLRALMPWRHLLVLGVLLAAAALAAARRPPPQRRSGRPATRRRGALAALYLLLVPSGLTLVGGDPATKYLAVSSSPPLATLIGLLRQLSDFDRDGFGSLLGENDCAPFDRAIHPGAPDAPDNGIDENCNGRDFSHRAPPSYRRGERLTLPEEYRRDWNFLLITVDTLRYDHTGLGGYKQRRGRDTTPRLDELAGRSVSFAFANAPSAGTMASVPAILASRFFHSGIALGPERKGMPPILLPENTLLPEVLKRKGYRTGAILSHYYFDDWGMQQGFDTYDNEVGQHRNPFAITSHLLTDRAVAWIAEQMSRRWFLWVHYIDPHGRYVAHPEEASWGNSEEDLYDAEIRYTDTHIGRLLRELSRMPGAERTVIVLTSDHGDGFNEHGFTNHGMALYREILHVPLIFHIPDLPGRVVEGAVSPMDIFPTVADLAGIDIGDLTLEGESLIPQLFYGRDAHHRVVFAETNYMGVKRAAITSRHKLVYQLDHNVHELYDLRADPWEKNNLAQRDPAAFGTMKGYLDDWLERVFYSRDPRSNQAAAKLAHHLPASPAPQQAVSGVTLDGGRIEVLGYDVVKPAGADAVLELAIYFRAAQPPSKSLRLQLVAVPGAAAANAPTAAGPRTAQGKPLLPAGGLFPTSRWRPGEVVREWFSVRLPADWPPGPLRVGLRSNVDGGGPEPVTGPALPAAGAAQLGELVATPPPPPAPAPGLPAPAPPGKP
jgi:arylsulfatase A-like enzyme